MKKMILVVLLLSLILIPSEAKVIQLVVDGENITEIAKPIIRENRMLVPIKFIADELDAEVLWDADLRSVFVSKGDKTIRLWIDSRLIDVNDGEDYLVNDVAPVIIENRTYVPLKLISDVFEVAVEWHPETWSVTIDSSNSYTPSTYDDVKFLSLSDGDSLTESQSIQLDANTAGAYEAQIMLLDPVTAKGFVRARNLENLTTMTYIPKPEDSGEKVLVYALFDADRKFISGQALSVKIDLNTRVELTGIDSSKTYSSLKMSQDLNFLPRYIDYTLINIDTNDVISITERDPNESYTFYPSYKQNGTYDVHITAYDSMGNAYESNIVRATVHNSTYLKMGGVKEGQTINSPVSLIASRNFDVMTTTYYIRDKNSETLEVLSAQDWGNYRWFPDATYSGEKVLYVEVTDVSGKVYKSNEVNVIVDGTPKLILYGVGPNQVLTKDTTLSATSNVEMTDIRYTLTATYGENTLSELLTLGDTFNFDPQVSDTYTVTVEGQYMGNTYKSSPIEFKSNLVKTYGPRAITEKSNFQAYISEFALKSFEETGMSASLQTAQAILETGWGQSLPVDKYTGKFSLNLFGIKGSASNGSVVSNTWEVYGGVTYRVDANFRAYNTVEESWADHKRILLELSRYAPYRAVMYDSTEGAWAVRRCGYATDPRYPMKLINIIDLYNLEALDILTI